MPKEHVCLSREFTQHPGGLGQPMVFQTKKKLLTMTIFIDNVNEEIGLGQLYLKNVLILCKIKH